ncbi:uncharacterized protein ARMOST_14642 [Armillaria ostoyae]|uniref:CxC2-like cysteine cluster KDZ transposase-associated domain-containing protein n=1 Tax=Armillaria ostoyae TaxID=47428 RepID=A0A284RR33_ARMOS|nr:uncharacterized protein ARMOST_14642 [Armillaria ostoyae]
MSFSEEQLEETKTTPAPVQLCHTEYNVSSAGQSSRLRTTTIYHKAPPSPSKARSSLHDPVLKEFSGVDLSWLDGPALEEENSDSDSEEEDQSMDPGASTEDTEVHQDDPHFRDWLPLTWEFLEEMFRDEHPRQFRNSCARCQTRADEATLYQCASCNERFMYCDKCMIARHYGNPLHRIQTGTFFKRTTLGALGLVMALGHDPDTCCPSPLHGQLHILDLEGIQTVHIDYCDCMQSLPHWRQLLRSQFFPSTVVRPQMATTFWTLEVFHLLSFMSKVSGYEFYHTLVRLTDNTGTCQPPSRFQAFMRMVREWHYLKLLKRMLDKSPRDCKGLTPGKLPIPPGSLAVKCPACPWPGINLEEDWEDDMVNLWKYSLFLAIDANFRLIRFVVSNAAQDPSLVNGGSFVVAQESFRKHVVEYGKRIPYDPSDCRDHQAVKLATSKCGTGLATSGVVMVDCARHDAKGPGAVTILDHGEEQVRMDYIFCSQMQQSTPQRIVVSYDINCQWSKKLWERIAIYPSSMTPCQHPDDFVHLIPKFHLPAHIPSCHVKYSFNKTPYVGQTDGEAPEHGWSRLNQLAASLKVMGPGGYLDMLDDHISDYNYRKSALMACSLLKAILEAIPARTLHSAVYAEFTASLPVQDVRCWTEAIDAWEQDPANAVNLFETTVTQLTTSKVHLTLAQEEATEMAKIAAREIEQDEDFAEEDSEDIFVVCHEVGPSTMILQGVELESDQRRLRLAHAALGTHSTDHDWAKVTEGLNRLRRCMDSWFEIQQKQSEMPKQEDPRDAGDGRRLDEMPLFLPSACLGRLRQKQKLMDFEFRLREAEAYECLMTMCQLLIYRSHLYKFKDKHVTGQMMSTRARSTVSNVVHNIEEAVTRYRKLRGNLVLLAGAIDGGKPGWDRQLRELSMMDVRPLEDVLPGETEGQCSMSWIWRVHRHDTDAEETTEALRIEWCKTRARAHRWHEEVILLEEEMKRVKAFFAYEGRTWLVCAAREDISEGEHAYALRQADIRACMRQHCIDLWVNVPTWSAAGAVPLSKRGRPRKPKTSNHVVV